MQLVGEFSTTVISACCIISTLKTEKTKFQAKNDLSNLIHIPYSPQKATTTTADSMLNGIISYTLSM